MKCAVCENEEGNNSFVVKERRIGTNDEFTYFKCAKCGCIQIVDIPEDIGRYYEGYYSLGKQVFTISSVFYYLRKQLFSYQLKRRNIFGWLLSRFGNFFPWIELNMFDFHSSILDVGCGSGRLLIKMANGGFSNLQGLDPFIENDISLKFGEVFVKIYKKELSDMRGSFDFIMLHHSFEHMADPHAVFNFLHNLLADSGRVMIRIPIIDSYTWEKYGTNSFHFGDAPRHFFLHTVESISNLCAKHNFMINKIGYEADESVLVQTEKLLRNIPLNQTVDFSGKERQIFKREANRLKKEKKSGVAHFYLSRTD